MGENGNTGQTHATIALGGGISCGWVIEGSGKEGGTTGTMGISTRTNDRISPPPLPNYLTHESLHAYRQHSPAHKSGITQRRQLRPGRNPPADPQVQNKKGIQSLSLGVKVSSAGRCTALTRIQRQLATLNSSDFGCMCIGRVDYLCVDTLGFSSGF